MLMSNLGMKSELSSQRAALRTRLSPCGSSSSQVGMTWFVARRFNFSLARGSGDAGRTMSGPRVGFRFHLVARSMSLMVIRV